MAEHTHRYVSLREKQEIIDALVAALESALPLIESHPRHDHAQVVSGCGPCQAENEIRAALTTELFSQRTDKYLMIPNSDPFPSPVGLYKVLAPDLMPHHGGTGVWTVGEPRTVDGPLVPCENGLHVCTLKQLTQWLGPCIHPVTAVSDEMVDHGDKMVFRSVTIGPALGTWTETTARLFAVDCAEHVLPIYEKAYANDQRPRNAIKAARQFARGEIDAAATNAAWAAATNAAWAAAWAAARDAARAAATDAAWAAARAAARAAAGAAARDAAWAAARDAAGAAARDSAWAAAWDSAWAAAQTWQADRLADYLSGRAS